jgi:hypothetical protein
MKVRLLLAALGATASLASGAGTAAADPTNSPKSFTIVAACDSGPITFTLLANPSPPGWTVTTSVGIAVFVSFTDTATGDVFVERDVRGFDENAVPTQTCVSAFPGVILTVKVFLTPATP